MFYRASIVVNALWECRGERHKGYFHSTMLMQALRKGFFSVKKKSDLAGRGFPPVAWSFFSFSFCFLFSSSSFMMTGLAASPLAAMLTPQKPRREFKSSPGKFPLLKSRAEAHERCCVTRVSSGGSRLHCGECVRPCASALSPLTPRPSHWSAGPLLASGPPTEKASVGWEK